MILNSNKCHYNDQYNNRSCYNIVTRLREIRPQPKQNIGLRPDRKRQKRRKEIAMWYKNKFYTEDEIVVIVEGLCMTIEEHGWKCDDVK